MKNLFYKFGILIIAVALVCSCGKDDGPSTPPASTAPTITGFSPKSGPVGTAITINGTNFSDTAEENTVKIGEATAKVTAATTTKITAEVSGGAETGKVSVAVDGETATGEIFTVTVKEEENVTPAFGEASYAFEADENIADDVVIGTLDATDADESDELAFSIVADESGLFEINAAGELSLAPEMNLDFDSADSYTITVAVTDGKDEATATVTVTVGDINFAPIFGQEAYQFEAQEGIAEEDIIGTIDATDADASDELTFGIPENDNGLFEINTAGELSLAAEMELDYETATEHVITVSVTDGTETVEVEVTITVLNVADTLAEDPGSFVTTWQTDAENETIYIGLDSDYNYDFTIDWGDGTKEELNLANPKYISHVYETAGQHTVAIAGDFPAISVISFQLNQDIFQLGLNPEPKEGLGLVSIEQWGDIQWQTMNHAFRDASSLENYNATDAPDLSQVTDMTAMFYNASKFKGGDLSNWKTGSVTDMLAMFQGASAFNGDLSTWNTSSVIFMEAMFAGASSFNKDISNWETENVKTMRKMFSGASAFNQNLGGWNIGSITSNSSYMDGMFDNSGMSIENMNATFEGWATFVEQNDGVPNTISCGAEGIEVCGPGATASYLLIENYEWVFPGLDPSLNCQ